MYCKGTDPNKRSFRGILYHWYTKMRHKGVLERTRRELTLALAEVDKIGNITHTNTYTYSKLFIFTNTRTKLKC